MSIVAIVGPTATGKTELALRLARAMPIEVVSADALQVYRGLDIGTAKPTREELDAVPHHLVDVLDPDEAYSAGRFASMARDAIEGIRDRGPLPVVVGGSGLYLRSLLEGIGELPPSEPRTREALQRRLADEGLEALWEDLARRDPKTAARLPRTDRQRILRALEIHEVSGRPMSSWLAERPFGQRRLGAIKVGLTLPRDVLYDRIASRVERMLARGWVEEVDRLLQAWRDPELPAFQAIGYRQLARHLRDGWPLETAVDDIVRATRRFAKRQLTWFRADREIVWFRAENLGEVASSVLRRIDAAGIGPAGGSK